MAWLRSGQYPSLQVALDACPQSNWMLWLLLKRADAAYAAARDTAATANAAYAAANAAAAAATGAADDAGAAYASAAVRAADDAGVDVRPTVLAAIAGP